MKRTVFVYQDLAGEWRWRLYAANDSDILADSGQGYSERNKAIRIARSVFKGMGYALEFRGRSGELARKDLDR